MTSRKRLIPWVIGPAALLAATTALAQAPGNVRGGPDQPAARNGNSNSNSNGPRQPGPPLGDRRPRGAVTPILLIGIGAVQEELKLTDAQKKKIRELNDAFDKRRRESADRLIKAEGGLDQGALMAMIADLRREHEEALSRVFDKRQRERVAQISLQLEGPMAVTRPEVAAKLNLDEFQLQQIQELKEQYEATREELHAAQDERFKLRADAFRPKADGPRPPAARPPAARPRPESEAAVGKAGRASGGPEPKREESEGERIKRESDELGARLVRELNKVLTRRQKTVFNRMLGEPFDLTKVQLRGGGQSGPNSLPPADAPGELEPIPPDNSRPASPPSKEGRPGPAGSKSGKSPRP